MPSLTLPIDPRLGLLVGVEIGVSSTDRVALVAAGRPVPPPVHATALLDTGAGPSGVDDAIMAKLGISATGFWPSRSPSTGGTVIHRPEYIMTVRVPVGGPSPLTLSRWKALGMGVAAGDPQVILGMDYLKRCRLVVDGPASTFTLSW